MLKARYKLGFANIDLIYIFATSKILTLETKKDFPCIMWVEVETLDKCREKH